MMQERQRSEFVMNKEKLHIRLLSSALFSLQSEVLVLEISKEKLHIRSLSSVLFDLQSEVLILRDVQREISYSFTLVRFCFFSNQWYADILRRTQINYISTTQFLHSIVPAVVSEFTFSAWRYLKEII